MTRASLPAAITLVLALGASIGFSSHGIAIGGPVSVSDLAPADEYFGREHLSPLGIRHLIFTLKDELHHGRAHPDVLEHKADLVQDAVNDWMTRFPRDSWLPAAVWQLATLYEELPGTQARESALAVLTSVQQHFPGTAYAADAAHDLSRGIGVRPWPHWAGTPPPPSASPTPSASPKPSATASHGASPSPSPAPSPQASTIADAPSLVRAVVAAAATPSPAQQAALQALEDRFWVLSRGGSDAAYSRAAWELAAAFERLPGETSRTQAIRLLALLVDRYPQQIFGRWAFRDLERGVGNRS